MTRQRSAVDAISWVPLDLDAMLDDPDVRRMNTEESGAYYLLWREMYRRQYQGVLPADDEFLADVAKVTVSKWQKLKAKVLRAFTLAEDGATITKKKIIETFLRQIRHIESTSAHYRRLGKSSAQAREKSRGDSTHVERTLNARSTEVQRTFNESATKEKEKEKEKVKEKKKTSADASPAKEPLPFRAEAAVTAIAEASAGRFVASKLAVHQVIKTELLIREHPDIATWRLAGEWIAAGGDGWKGTLDVRQCGDFPQWIAHAVLWNADGRKPLQRGSPQQLRLEKPMDHVAETRDWTEDL